jgi:hypothetical protein
MKDIDIDAAIALSKELDINEREGESAIATLVEAIRKAEVLLTSEDAVSLDSEEQKAMNHLIAFAEVVKGWGLSANQQEMTQGLHVLQGFIVQHMLYRLNPAGWSDWYRGE